MAWPTPSLDDLVLTENGAGTRWLHALCLAVSERENATGAAFTRFHKSNGTTGFYLDLEEVQGLWVGGEDDGAITNLNLCMTAIKTMLAPVSGLPTYYRFQETPGLSGAPCTLTSIQTAVGLGSFPAAAESWTDLNFWKQIKGALDLMLYCRCAKAPSGQILTHQTSDSALLFDDASQELWDEARADSGERPPPAHTPFNALNIGWYLYISTDGEFGGLTAGHVVLRSDARCNFVTGCNGTLTEAYYAISARASTTSNPGWEIDPVGSGPAISVSNNYDGLLAGPSLTLEGVNQTDYGYTSIPDDHPSTFIDLGTPPGDTYIAMWCEFDIHYADFYFTPTFADQT